MILSYIDKAIVFAGPLFVLFLLRDKTLYNQVEYVYAIAPLIGAVLNGNLTTYFLPAYRDADDRKALVQEVRGYFYLQLAIALAAAAIVLAIWRGHGVGLAVAIGCTIRGIFLLAQSFYLVYYRLLDAPSRAFIFSISGGAGTVAIVVGFWLLHGGLRTWHFFAAQAAVTVMAGVMGGCALRHVRWGPLVRYFWKALVFCWPVMVNVLAMSLLTNMGKIYSFSALSADDMSRLSLIQRSALIVTLTSSGMISYMAKTLFLGDSLAGAKKAFLAYASVILASAAFVIAVLGVLPHVSKVNSGPIDLATVALVFGAVLWCFDSYGEFLMLKYQLLKLLPVFSVLGFMVSAAFFYFGKVNDLQSVALAQLAGTVVTFVCVSLTVLMRMRRNRPNTGALTGR